VRDILSLYHLHYILDVISSSLDVISFYLSLKDDNLDRDHLRLLIPVDFVSNVLIAKKGFPSMAIAACISAPFTSMFIISFTSMFIIYVYYLFTSMFVSLSPFTILLC
jgi:hypothetical protein